MAALSCYQPCRSHLAQPARCLDDEEYSSATLSLRRRQERCEPRRREPLPEVSVQRTREQLAKHAAQTLPARRLNHDGWAKVEEVRKKFEGAATATSYSRSFESPPRRRLADSLFASFKLPRKKEMSAPRAPQPQQKRKSAVELLAETKAFYVKSETVLDRKQELPLRVSSGLSQAIAAGGCHLVSSGALNDACCNPYATTRITGSRRAVSAGEGLQNTLRRLLEHADSRENVYQPPYVYATTRITGSRRAVSAGEGLQNTLRRLLEHADSRENVYPPPYVSQKLFSESRRLKDSYPERERSQHTSGAYSGTSSSGTSGGPRDERNRHSFGDARVFFPESFVIPRQRPEVVVKSAYSIPSPESSPRDGLPELSRSGDQLDTISPPAEYAHSAPRYIRSNSHSAPSAREGDATNINSHKSLPDLHAQAHGYPEHANPVVGSESTGRSPRRRRHSAHHRTASCSSKGTRSNHSSLMSSCDAFSEHPSPGEENYQSYNSRCGSSFARDSGGSSGHYTQRSAPPHSHDVRPSRYAWPASGGGGGGGGGAEPVYVSAPPQFQDGAPSPPQYAHAHAAPHPPHTPSRVGIHFQASAPPPQFQDEPPEYGEYDCTYKAPLKCLNVGRKDYTKTREYSRYHEPNTEVVNKQPQYQEVRMRPNIDEKKDYVNAPQVCQTEEVTSPLGTFKRQRCLRYKQRRPRPILRSKSDISDRYRRSDTGSAPGEASPGSGSSGGSALQHFFDHLGLEGRTFDALFRDPPASPVFFSSASTVDSNQLAATADYTVQGPGVQKQIYRNTEPPSVVERNARIIKWLCQCRKAQMQTPQ